MSAAHVFVPLQSDRDCPECVRSNFVGVFPCARCGTSCSLNPATPEVRGLVHNKRVQGHLCVGCHEDEVLAFVALKEAVPCPS